MHIFEEFAGRLNFERENAKSKNRGPPEFFKTAKATCYTERRVAEKSEISGATFTSPAKCYKIDRKGSYWVIFTRKHCDDLYTISTGKGSCTGYCVSGIKGGRHIQWGAQFSGVLIMERLCCVFISFICAHAYKRNNHNFRNPCGWTFGQSIRKLLTQTMRSTQRKQTIVYVYCSWYCFSLTSGRIRALPYRIFFVAWSLVVDTVFQKSEILL